MQAERHHHPPMLESAEIVVGFALMFLLLVCVVCRARTLSLDEQPVSGAGHLPVHIGIRSRRGGHSMVHASVSPGTGVAAPSCGDLAETG